MPEFCGNCFNKIAADVCPHCGFSASAQKEKYPLALQPGTILDGRYILGRVLGQGGFGITYIAWDDRTHQRIAIKEYLPTELAGRKADNSSVQVYSVDKREVFDHGKDQFLVEAKTLASFIGNLNIVQIYSYFEANNTAYFTMEYVDGDRLDKYMKHHGGRLDIASAGQLLMPIMDALAWVHSKGLVHRDISPDNILVKADGTAKLIDFGAARYSTGEKSKSLDVILKHGFAPKEQYMRRGRQGPFTDVYAMAATFYYAITGRVPPEALQRMDEDELIDPSALGLRMPGKSEDVLMKALEISAQDRYQTMNEFRDALKSEIQHAGPASPAPPSPVPVPSAEQKADKKQDASSPEAFKPAQTSKSKYIKIIAALLCAVFIAGFFALWKFAGISVDSGSFGNISWEETSDGTLTLSGNGYLPGFNRVGDSPWYDSGIKKLIVSEGVLGIGQNSFYGYDTLTSVSLPSSLKKIESGAFALCNNLETVHYSGSAEQLLALDIAKSGNEKLVYCIFSNAENPIVSDSSPEQLCEIGLDLADTGFGPYAAMVLDMAIEQGDSAALSAIVYMYNSGDGLTRIPIQVMNYYEKAIAANDYIAIGNIINALSNSNPDGYSEALEEYEKAAAPNNDDAMVVIGFCHRYGLGAEADEAKAAEYFEKAAEYDNTTALNFLAGMYYYGLGIEQNYDKALKLRERAIALGHVDLLNNLGIMYEYGQGVPADREKGIEYYREAAEKGSAAGYINLGLKYKDDQEYEKAAEMYRIAAEKNLASGMVQLATAYKLGTGVEQNNSEAIYWYEKAANLGNFSAMLDLAEIYHKEGETELAYHWISKLESYLAETNFKKYVKNNYANAWVSSIKEAYAAEN